MTELETRLRAMLTPNADGLLPCPWCGEATHLIAEEGYAAVVCLKCDADGPMSHSIAKAIAAWNSRPLVRALLEAVKQREWSLTASCDDVNGTLRASEANGLSQSFDQKILAILDGKEGA